MKLFIASDIHGSAYWCRKMLDAFEDSGAERIILLGDILYHGPRNELPDGYAPKEVIAMLNPYAHRILCVRGNCEAEVDQMVLEFPVMAEYAVICADGGVIYASHGHKAGPDTPPPIKGGEILLCGHTHVPANRKMDGFVYMNPGSVSIPKNGSPHSYMFFDSGEFIWYSLENGESYDPNNY